MDVIWAKLTRRLAGLRQKATTFRAAHLAEGRPPSPYDCRVCGCASDLYMVHDELWRQAGFGKRELACLGCLEKRLGRGLVPSDFKDVLCNRALLLGVRMGLEAAEASGSFVPVTSLLPVLRDDPDLLDRLCSVPVLALYADARQAVVKFWVDPDDGSSGWTTECSNGWDVTAHVVGWRTLPSPVLAQDPVDW